MVFMALLCSTYGKDVKDNIVGVISLLASVTMETSPVFMNLAI